MSKAEESTEIHILENGIKVDKLFSTLCTSMKDLGCGQVNENLIGRVVKLAGWVESVRDHGGLKFIDLVDITGEVQIVVRPETVNADALKDLDNIGNFYVLNIEGEVRRRPEGTENPNISTGKVEVLARSVKVLSKSDVPPFWPNERKQISEEVRLKYRYIDMRRPQMRKNIIFRHLVARKIREFMWSKNFTEIETPFLTKSTPEGARDFLVPSRLYKGKFYALPQSPQLFKQILQVAGFERYFQIVRCFRDEDLRADRQPEFTQVDIEMSFVSEDDIITLVEELLHFVFKECLDVEIKIPFPKMSYQDAISLYGTDKPDTRIPFHIKDLSGAFSNTKIEFIRKFLDVKGKVLAFGVKNISASKSQLVSLESFAKSMGGGGLMWFVFKEKQLVASPLIKFISDEEKEALSQLCDGNGISFAVADTDEKSRAIISKVAKLVAKNFSLVKDSFNFVWVVDFPLFSWDETEKRFVSEHHPFTSPKYEDLGFIDTDPLKVRARAYDIVLNGEEIGGGSIRIHDPELQYKIFKILNLSQEEINERFGWFLEALKYGAPPHGGIALGLDRLVALMLGEESIREVIAFPKTQSGVCPLTGAPSDVYLSQLKELGIKVETKE